MRKLFEFRILLVLCLLALGVNGVWAETYTHTWTATNNGTGSVTLSSKSWTIAYTWEGESYFGYDATKGNQMGSGKKPARTITLSTSAFSSSRITSISVNASTASDATATLSVTVGGESYINTSLTSSAQTYTKENGTSTGDIVLTISQPSTSKALYIKSISITYESDTRADHGLTYATSAVTKEIGVTGFVNPLTNPNSLSVTYESDNTAVATVNATTGAITALTAGEATITASFTGNATYKAGSASYTLTVTDNRADHGLTYATSAVPTKIGVTGFVNPLTNPNSLSVTYESDNTAVATVNATTGAITALTAGEATITASFTGNATYKAGSASYTLTVSDGAKWVKVTDAAKLHAGDQIIIVNETAGKVLSTTQNTNNRKAEDITLEGGIATMNSDAQIITLSKNSGSWILNVDEGHLYTISSSNHLKISSDNTALATEGHYVTFNITSGNADIKFPFTGDDKDKYVQYNPNSGNPIFSAYKSGQSAVQIYKKISDVSVTVSSVGYATLHYGDRALTVPAGMEAYTYLVNAQNKLEESWRYEEGDVIPAGQAVVLKADAGTYIFELATTDGQADADSQLKGLDEEGTTTGTGKFYHLTLVDKDDVSKGAGFFWGNDGGAAFTIAAHKAYLVVPTAGVRGYMFNGEVDDDLTAIESAVVKSAQGPIYDLQGRRVEKMTRGIYLVDGKKVMK